MTRRIKKHIVTAVIAGIMIIAGAGLGLYFKAFGDSATEPSQAASVYAEHKTESRSPGEKEWPAERPKSVLKSALAGSWYPADPEALKKMLKGFFDSAQVSPRNDVVAVILPHAGYSYSGKTACAGLKAIARHYERIIVIGPSHSVRMEDILSVPRVTHYETPLGQIPLDVEFIDRLLEYPVFQNVPHAHQSEHSVQIELPLLQSVDSGFKLVPMVAGSCSLQAVQRAAAILKSMVDENTLVVASSDFVHYGASYGYVPFTENIPEQLKKLDTGALKLIEALDVPGFLEYREKTGATICGYIPIAVLLSMLDKSSKAELINYTTSGQLEGDYSRSVSYLSIVFSGTWRKGSTMEPPARDAELTDSDRKKLINLARKTIGYALEHGRVPETAELGIEISDTLKEPRAAFVTLKKAGRLRGCIGDIFPSQPLYKSVLSNAINAAFRDRRFTPLQKEEFNDITIEISALTRPKSVPSANDIRIGTDGIVLNKAGRSAVFLPQVASEQGWDLSQTLTQLSLKAGLAADDWNEGAAFLVFQADVFGEGEK
ncbi:MAG: AmmeMemoRadiSam system protein B [Sedimentisphaerales bacterium]|nr:AmmeMemoRadiSam system protein B [Sedimentisphaerales bacterium]